MDLKIEEVEDVEILSVLERKQSHHSAFTSAKPLNEAFAWLVGGDATTTNTNLHKGASGQGRRPPHSRERWPHN